MYDYIINKYASQYSVPPSWIIAVIQKESSFNPNAISPATSAGGQGYGLMQLLYSTALGLGYSGDIDGLYDPDTNIQYGTKLIAQIRQSVGDDAQAMYSAYNSGGASNYLTNPTVALHVQQFMADLQDVIAANPLVASSGLIGGAIVLLLIWYWSKKKGK